MPAPKDPEKYKVWIENQRNRIVSEETRAKLRAARKGRTPRNKGSRHTEETKLKIKLAQNTPEMKAAKSKVHKGKIISPEHKEKLRLANLGRHPTDETIKKIRDAQIGKPRKRGWKQSEEWIKRRFSDVARKHMREGALKNFENEEYRLAHAERSARNAVPNKHKSGYYFSNKAGNLRYKSSYELAYFKMLDEDKNVVSYVYEPLRIIYEFEGKKRTYCPDFKVNYKNGVSLIVEVKAAWDLERPNTIAKLEKAKEVFGDKFLVLTEKDLDLCPKELA